MTAPVVLGLSRRDAQIVTLQGLPVDRIAELGVYRGTRERPAWTRADVLRQSRKHDRAGAVEPAPCSCAPRTVVEPWEPPSKEGEARVVAVLTPRQANILTALCEGLSNAAIGECLGLSEGAVKNRLKPIYAALGARDRTHAVVLALRGRVDVKIGDSRSTPKGDR